MTSPAAAAPRSLLLAALLLAAWLAPPPAAARADAEAASAAIDSTSDQRLPLPERLMARLRQERAQGHDRAVLELAFEIVDRHPEFDRADRALLAALLAAQRLGDHALARQLAAELRAKFPRSAVLAQIPKISGESLADTADALTLRLVGEAEARHPAEQAVTPAPAVRSRRTKAAAPVAEPALIGLICATSPPDSQKGMAWGARQNVRAANRQWWRQCRIEAIETEGDAGRAALAVRQFAERGAIAVIADLDAPAALAAGVAADSWGMPLVVFSPDAAELRGLSDWVTPVDLVDLREQRLLARLAVSTLDRRRAAVLYPDTEEGARACAAFGRALLAAGGRLVAMASCRPDAADAERALRDLAATRPELLYLPFAAAALSQLAASLQASPTGALALGRASWSGAPAEAFATPALEGAVFMSDVSVWPAAWRAAFADDMAGAGLVAYDVDAAVVADVAGLRAVWRGFAGTRLVGAALAECGAQPRRGEVAGALRAAWGRLRDAPAPKWEATQCARRVENGRVTTVSPTAAVPAGAAH